MEPNSTPFNSATLRQPLGAALDLYRPTEAVRLIVFDPDEYVERVLRHHRDGARRSLR